MKKNPKAINYDQRVALGNQVKALCGYLRKPYMSKGLPRGECALRRFQRCTTPQFIGVEGVVERCYTFDKFLEYRAMKGDLPTDIEEWNAYKFKNPPKYKETKDE